MTDEFDILHALRIKGRVPADQVGADPAALAAAADAGLVKVTERGALLTGPGLLRHGRLLAAQVAAADGDGLARAYDRFLQVNPGVKEACSRWQAAGAEATDDDLFAAVDSLERAFSRIDRPLAGIAGDFPRFGGYRARLQAALERAGEGRREAVADPGPESFHTAWFECHEDFLVSLGRDREEDE
ncbi:hypothetical protein HUN08_14390 [Gordonia sp. X0973]|uniref:hypothetical protein n=1 Tax=Gordonia sp. X0973 TaxID=2742602 RepID=UPI0013ECEAD2|nr:hypothetical protein [Gordonia sp. X0973]QKT08254.1 hypothetical protein HUN08_14390 [Gordonia sp. X0973]